MADGFNRLGRGEAIRRLLEDKKPPAAPPSEAENSLSVKKTSGGRGIFLSRNKQQQPTEPPASNQESATTALTTPAPNGFGRAHLFNRTKTTNGTQPSSSRTNGNQPTSSGDDSPVESSFSSLNIDVESKPNVNKGSSGKPWTMVTNYVRLEAEPGRAIYQYDVRFEPEIDSRNIRLALLKHGLSDIVGKTTSFDGAMLYLPFRLDEKVTNAPAERHDGTKVNVKITFVKEMRVGDKNAVHFYNVLFRKIMSILGLVLHGRNFFDATAGISVPEHRLEVWPGYVTAIQEFEDGVMLCCDTSHRVLKNETVFDMLSNLGSDAEDEERWRNQVTNHMVGQTVLTRYNNKVYHVDDIDFSSSPKNKFTLKSGEEITYIQYYQRHYGIEIKDYYQPLLKSKVKIKIRGEEICQFVDLIPELCYMSGITDEMRNNKKLMIAIAAHTRIAPAKRHQALLRCLQRIHTNLEASKLLSDWGIRLYNKSLSLPGRVLHPETIFTGGNCDPNLDMACDWSRLVTSNPVLSAVDLVSWVILCPRQVESTVKKFIEMASGVCRKMGINIHPPRMILLPNDKTPSYVQELKRLKNQQMALIVMMNNRADIYSAIKTVCCVDNPVPSQVVIAKTIRDDRKLRSVAQKIVLQMNCKLGGTLWQVKVPVKNTMILGLDTYHDPSRKSNSVGAVVASMNESLTRWYSTVYRQDVGTELHHGLEVAMTTALVKYQEVRGAYPNQIIIYRDGLGDGQLQTCSLFEIKQLQRAFKKISLEYSPKMLYIVVQKRIMTRFFAQSNAGAELTNPPPGSVMDHSITRRDMYDFFLVSQSVRQGTVSPTHYVVVEDTTSMDPDKVQMFTYKMTHLYYNWCGTVRVPAPCQYAHKLAYLVGENLHRGDADESLKDKLFYL